MKKRGLKRFVCTRIWNKGDSFKLGILFEYDTKELMTMAKMEGSRGISVFEV